MQNLLSFRPARVIELERGVPDELVCVPQGLVGVRERRSCARSETLHHEESRGYLLADRVARIEREQSLDVWKRAFGLTKMVRVEIDECA